MGNTGKKKPKPSSSTEDVMPMMPAPPPADWAKLYGSWEGFMREVHKSIGKNLGQGVIRFSRDQSGEVIKPET